MPEGAIFHWQMRKTQRGAGQSAVAGAAYQSGGTLTDERTGIVHDFRRKGGIRHTEIVLPAYAAPVLRDRATLWNLAEAAEKHPRAVVARTLIVALPHTLSPEDRLEALREHARWLADEYGVAVDLAAHAPHGRASRRRSQAHDRVEAPGGDARNHHGHFRITTRIATDSGLGPKTRILDDRATGPAEVERMRAAWQATLNRRLEAAGIAVRVDHRSKARIASERGEAPEPVAPHLTVAEVGDEHAGRRTRRGDRWRQAKADQRQHRRDRDDLREVRRQSRAAERNARALRLAEAEAWKRFAAGTDAAPDAPMASVGRPWSAHLPTVSRPKDEVASILELMIPNPVMVRGIRRADGACTSMCSSRTTPRNARQRQWRKDVSAYLAELAEPARSTTPLEAAFDGAMASTRVMYGLAEAATERVADRLRRTVAIADSRLLPDHDSLVRTALRGRRTEDHGEPYFPVQNSSRREDER